MVQDFLHRQYDNQATKWDVLRAPDLEISAQGLGVEGLGFRA